MTIPVGLVMTRVVDSLEGKKEPENRLQAGELRVRIAVSLAFTVITVVSPHRE
jgi:hypothetical protein